MHTLHTRPLCFIPYLKKTIYLIPFIFLNASIGYGSSGVTIIPDYTALNRLTIYPITQHNQKVSGLINLLDKEFPTTEGLYQYLSSVQSLEDVSALIAVAKELLAVPDSSRRDHQKSIRFNHTYIEERAFHILNFAYLMRHTHTHWLRYYYAFSIIAFPESAKEKLEKTDPIRFAIDIYKHWSEERKSELYAREIHFGGKGDIPLPRINLKSLQAEYQKAQENFYSLMSSQTLKYNLRIESMICMTDEDKKNLAYLKSIRNTLVMKMHESGMESNQQNPTVDPETREWIDGPYAFALGAAAATALSLASKGMGQSLNH